MVILYPPERGWDLFERGLGLFTNDFMAERRQPGASDRRREMDG